MKDAQVKVVLKCNGIWIANGKFGCTWRAEQIRVKVPEGGLQEFAIMSDSEDDDDGDDDDSTTETNEVEMIEDSSGEEEEEKPEPPKKKAVKRKVKVSKSSA